MYLNTSKPLGESLAEFVEASSHGARLPTVRQLMREYNVGQATVQTAIAALKDRGLVEAAVGRGTYVVKTGSDGAIPFGPAPQPALDSLLILSNSSMNERCARVQHALVDQVRTMGGKVVQISYHHTDHLLELLKTVPKFDAVVLQSHYESIPIRLLSILQSKARAIVVDGHTVSGVDVDRMGIDWEDALLLALDDLTGRGHERVALVTLDSASQPILMARRFFQRFDNWKGRPLHTVSAQLEGPVHPSDSVQAALSATLENMRIGTASGPTALVLLGVSDGAGVLAALETHAGTLGTDTDIVLLGHTDVPSEHMNTLPVAGGSSREGAEELMKILQDRLADRRAAPIVRYIPTRLVRPQRTTAPGATLR